MPEKCSLGCQDAETMARMAVFEEQLNSLGLKFNDVIRDVMVRFTKHMDKEEASFKALYERLRSMDAELKAAFKERDEKYVKMAALHAEMVAERDKELVMLKLEHAEREAEKELAHIAEINALKMKQTSIYTAASVVVVCVGIVAKFI